MEYMTMLAEPGLVSRLQELIDDKEPEVVKRTIRVFTNVYRHSLSLVASGELEPQKYEQSYEEISAVSNKLIGMLKTAENEGIVVHLVRYLEAALVSHILSDLSQFPHIAQMTAPVLKKGVDALLEFVKTPYVGGSAFCVAIRALISVACYQVNLRPCITQLVEDLIDSPPPNLFDHNIRSFHKTLQRNLFRLLKRADLDGDKEKLVSLMVRVGVPRRRLTEFAPRHKKRAPPSAAEPGCSNRLSPPLSKRIKLTEEEIIRFRPTPSIELTPEEIRRFGPQSLPKKLRCSPSLEKMLSDAPKEIPLEPKPKASVSITSILDHILSDEKMPSAATSVQLDAALVKAREKLSSLERGSTLLPVSGRNERIQPMEESNPSLGGRFPSPDSNDSSPKSPSPPAVKLEAPSDFEKTILNLVLEKEENLSDNCEVPFSENCSLREGMIYEKLDCGKVVEILLASPCELPLDIPDCLQKTFIYDLKIMREKLAVALALYLHDEDFCSSSFIPLASGISSEKIQQALSLLHSRKLTAKRRFSDDCEEKPHAKLEQTSHSLNNSPLGGNSPIRDSLFSGQDVDLRQQLKNIGGSGIGRQNHQENLPVNVRSTLGDAALDNITDSPASPESPQPSYNRDPRLARERQTKVDPRLERSSLRKSVSPPVSSQGLSSRDPRLARISESIAVLSKSGIAVTSSAHQSNAGSVFSTNSLPNAIVSGPTRDPRIESRLDPRAVSNANNTIEQNFLSARDANSYMNPNSRDPRLSSNLTSGQMPGQQYSSVNRLKMSNGSMPPGDSSQNLYLQTLTSNLDPRQSSNVDPRQGPNVDPRQGPNVDTRQGPNVDPRMGPNADPRMGLNVNPRMGPNVDPRQGPNVDPRQGPNVDPRMGPNVDPRMGPNVDPRIGSNVDPRQGLNVDPRTGPNVDPRQGLNVDPRMGPNVDHRNGSNVDPRRTHGEDSRQIFNMDPRQSSNVDPRHLSNVDPRHVSNVDPRRNLGVDQRQNFNAGPRHNLGVDPQLPNMDPRRIANAPTRPHRQPLLGAAPRPLGYRGPSAPLLQTPGHPPLLPPVPVYAVGSASTFGNSYALSRYSSAESRNRF